MEKQLSHFAFRKISKNSIFFFSKCFFLCYKVFLHQGIKNRVNILCRVRWWCFRRVSRQVLSASRSWHPSARQPRRRKHVGQGIIHNRRHSILVNFWHPLSPSSLFLYYGFSHKILDTFSPLRPWRHLRTTPQISNFRGSSTKDQQ